MFAIVDIAGFQEIASKGMELMVPRLRGNVGDRVIFDKVLLVSTDGQDAAVGTPHLAGATVEAVIKAHGRHDKIRVYKFKRRKRYQRTRGHRQPYSAIEILQVVHGASPGGHPDLS